MVMAVKRAGLSAGAPMCTYAGRRIEEWRQQDLSYAAIGKLIGISKEHTINIHQHGRGAGNSVEEGLANVFHGGSIDAARTEADIWYAKYGPWRGTKAEAPERIVDVERPLRYPPMSGALAMGRAMGMPESFLRDFAETPHEGAETADAEDWFAMLKKENRLREQRENDPEFRKQEDARDEKKTSDLETELAPKMPGKKPPKSPSPKRKK